jgi:FkbM family methyltransferase
MAISPSQARAVTGLYSLTRKSGLLETGFGRKLFTSSYFLYKRYLEDPFAALAKRHPELFRGGDILDVGANIGYTASLFAQAADADAKVYAFEPEPFNFELLQCSIRDRHLQKKVVAVHSAVGERSGEIELWINDHHHADHRIATESLRASNSRANDGYVTVPITSIDEFLAHAGAARPICLIKIDVQGYESAVCHGMTATVEQQRRAAVAIEYMPEAMAALGYDPPALLDWFVEKGFRMYSLGRNGELTPGLSSELAEKGYVDLIFSRREVS